MTTAHTDEPARRKPLRLWPGVAAVAVQWLAWFAAPVVLPLHIGGYVAAIGLLGGGLAVVAWWAFFSRAARAERWGAVALMIVAMAVTPRFLHRSVAEGNLGFQYFLYAVPVLSLAFVFWAVAGRHLADGHRRAAMVATIVFACGMWTFVRSDGLTGDGSPEFVWRWTQTSEERLLARAGDERRALPSRPPPAPAVAVEEADWPGFRGPRRDGAVRGLRIETDWSKSPPVELWRRPIGPGVSSFAVGGGLLYTQEQRGDDEVVACYKVTTGEPMWMHRDATRFWDSHVGAGPRATPALAGGRVYALGATGVLNALDAADGSVVWSRDAAADTGAKLPMFGFVSSPLALDDLVVVAVRGQLAAYDAATGEPRWTGPAGGGSNSSPHLLTLDGVPQILLLNGAGASSVAPDDGALLWEHTWPGGGIAQPARSPDGDVLISTLDNMASPLGMLRLAVSNGPGGWTVEERWTSAGLKPTFSSFVVHEGHAYGFDGRLLACLDLDDGEREWKGGRFGVGLVLLLPDQDVLLVVSERGGLALVAATPDRFTELARFPGIEGKTWTQPALVNDVLLLRNAREMAAFRLSLAPALSRDYPISTTITATSKANH